MDSFSKRALRVAGIYAVFGVLWIVFSDRILAALAGDAARLTEVQTFKGIGYVAATAYLVYWLARRVLLEQDRLATQAHESEARFATTFEQAAVGIAQVAPDGHLLRVNRKFCEYFGYTREELLRLSVEDITVLEDLDLSDSERRRLLVGEIDHIEIEKRYRRKDGSIFWGNVTSAMVHDPGGKPAYLISVVEDISPRKKAEEEHARMEAQLLQAQKMEAVGRLAGGIAHDFNNMLSVILGGCESAMISLGPDHAVCGDLEEVVLAAQRSSALTRQLLAFARKSVSAPRVINLNAHIEESRRLLIRLLGEEIELEFKFAVAAGTVLMDPSHLDQILANFAVNSRDAITGSGTVEIQTENVRLNAEGCRDIPGAQPGAYVRLKFADSGCGMDEATLNRAFEPFFTTKEPHKGTGLGLATIYGIVQQAGGCIAVESAPGRGTTFSIYLPRQTGEVTAKASAPAEAAGGKERILLVEDEVQILHLCRRALEQRGYTVLAYDKPEAALEAARASDFELLVTDVMMPRMNGGELSKRVQEFRPDVKVLYMSGHTANVIAEHGILPEGMNFLQKPFAPSVLLKHVRHVLDQAPV